MKNLKLVLAVTLAIVLGSCVSEKETFNTQKDKNKLELSLLYQGIKVALPLQSSPLFAPIDPVLKENVLKSFDYEMDWIANKKSGFINNVQVFPEIPKTNITFVPIIINNYERENPKNRIGKISSNEPFKIDKTHVLFYQKTGNTIVTINLGEYFDFQENNTPEREADLRKRLGDECVNQMIKGNKSKTESEKWTISISNKRLKGELQYAINQAGEENVFIYRNPFMYDVCYFKGGELFVCKEDRKNRGSINAMVLKASDIVTAISYDMIY